MTKKLRRYAEGGTTGDASSFAALIKRANEQAKDKALRGLEDSKDESIRDMTAARKRERVSDTGTMWITRPGYGRRIDSNTGKATGPELKKNPRTGDYEPFKKGGVVKSASSRADGIARRGRTKGTVR